MIIDLVAVICGVGLFCLIYWAGWCAAERKWKHIVEVMERAEKLRRHNHHDA